MSSEAGPPLARAWPEPINTPVPIQNVNKVNCLDITSCKIYSDLLIDPLIAITLKCRFLSFLVSGVLAALAAAAFAL